jgi:hypothetical protein
MKITIFTFLIACFGAHSLFAQSTAVKNEEYLKVITLRASKITSTLNLTDSIKFQKVTNIIRDQYSNLNDIYAIRDAKIKEIETNFKEKSERDAAIANEYTSLEFSLAQLHKKYLKKLGKELSDSEIDMVKNGMTYNVLPITFKAYQEQILTLTEEQKKQIFTWLIEAREHAMDAESSKKKHAWFGKYKGRINNYLSAAGYDLKKEGIEWEKRIKDSKQKITNNKI